MRRELEHSRSQETLSEPVRRMLGRLDENGDFRQIIALSYSAAQPSDFAALDEFWTRFMTHRGDNAGFLALLSVRAQLQISKGGDREAYLQDWLYLAQNGNYDCGGGGGNCGVGVGNGGGDGTTNEGGGGDTAPDGDGDSGGGNDGRPGNAT